MSWANLKTQLAGESLPAFTNKEIQSFVEKANKNVYGENARKIKKNFERGKQLVRENFVDLFRFMVKEEGDCVHVKALVGASLRQKCHWVSVSLNKHSATIEFCHCICEAGKGGTCSHAYAVLHLLAKWSLDQLTEVPDPTPITSSLCAWNVPQARGRADTPSFMNIRFRSATAKKRRSKSSKQNDNKKRRSNSPGCSTSVESSEPSSSDDSDAEITKESKGISSTAYEARSVEKQNFDEKEVEELISNISLGKNSSVSGSYLFQSSAPYGYDLTRFGEVPVGSPVGYQCSFIEFGYKVYCSFVKSPARLSNTETPVTDFPPFPVNVIPNFVDNNLANSITDTKELDILKQIMVDRDYALKIEEDTREQYLAKNWGKERFYRFTASLHNDLREKKTERSYGNLAKQLLEKRQMKTVPNYYVKKKLDHGRFFEPEAIKVYTDYFKMIGHPIVFDKCGFVINTDYYFMGASPDGKVTESSLEGSKKFGILEVKCPEQFKNVDPKHAAMVAENFCLELCDDGELRINTNHAYYDQIQHQLAMTGCHYCDFIVYTFKGAAIDRVYFDSEHWKKLCQKVCSFYFKYFLKVLSKTI